MDEIKNRRPLKSRSSNMAVRIARWLSQRSITPNQISIASVVFAALSAWCLFNIPIDSSHWIFPIAAAVFIQLRLLCNLFDGMVAIEGGKSTPAGDMFNDIPDRFADAFILIAAGYAAPNFAYSTELGWCAALLAVGTAYVRTLDQSIGAPADYRGPMAKQHRMALMTLACVLTAFEHLFTQQGMVMYITLWTIAVGSLITIFRRMHAAYRYLEAQ